MTLALNSYTHMKVRPIKSATSWPVLAVWVLMSVFVAATCSLGFLQPSWIVKHETRFKNISYLRDFETNHQPANEPAEILSLGVYSYCYRLEHVEDIVCHMYGASMDLRRYPSAPWQAACVLYGGGCIFLISCALVAVLCLGLPTDMWRQRVAMAVGHTQAAGVAILLSALLIYPFGFPSPFVRHHCGTSAGFFNAGECRLGWSYTLAIMSSLLSIYCPVLAKFSTYHIYEPDYWTYCSNI
ncbi:hypothetical protein CHUAL_005291 [Chamberlinius hualienensis]